MERGFVFVPLLHFFFIMKIPITIESNSPQEAFDWYIIAMKDYGTSVRTLDIMKKLYQYQEKGIIEFIGDLKYEWQYALRWNKTELKKRGLIKKHIKGKHTYWTLT